MFDAPLKNAILSTVAAAIVATGLFLSPAYAEGGGGGGRDASDRVTTQSAGKTTKITKTTKKKKSKSEIHAEAVKDVYLNNGMRYFFSKEVRMKRLLERMYQEEKAGQKHIKTLLQKIDRTGLGKSAFDRKFQPTTADNVLQASRNYNSYKKGKISKKTYERRVKFWLGFVP